MPKTDLSFNPDEYALVADRIALFYERYPMGRIIPRLHAVSEKAVIFEARVYRDRGDAEPAATGWAREFEGDGEINQVACLENTETSAIGRAPPTLASPHRRGAQATRRWRRPTGCAGDSRLTLPSRSAQGIRSPATHSRRRRTLPWTSSGWFERPSVLVFPPSAPSRSSLRSPRGACRPCRSTVWSALSPVGSRRARPDGSHARARLTGDVKGFRLLSIEGRVCRDAVAAPRMNRAWGEG